MNILGISGQERDAAAALVRDGVVIATIEEEKLSRMRHVGMNYAGGLPSRAIEFCLEKGGLAFKDLDYVAYYLEPRAYFRRTIGFRLSRIMKKPGFSSVEAFPYYFVDGLNGMRQRYRTRKLATSRMSKSGKLLFVNHQLAHAASAFYPSGFDRAAIIVPCNRGDMNSFSLLTGEGSRLKMQAQAQFPNSLGIAYDAVTSALGFGFRGDPNKTMWLAATGENEFSDLFKELLEVDRKGLPKLNLKYFDPNFRGGPNLSQRFYDKTGIAPRQKECPITLKHRNVAASLQIRIEDMLCEIASRFREQTGEENLCMAGGIALNSLANAAIEKRSGFRRLFVQPAAGNAGCSLGAALYVWHEMLGNTERKYTMGHLFLGPQYDEEDIKEVLDNCKIDYEYCLTEEKLIGLVAKALQQGDIIGWFRGAMEFGPRTLGARSILASPLTEMMRDNLNTFIKHREDFRPFSAAIPEEKADEFFEPSALTDFIQGVSHIKSNKRAVIPAAVFGDGLVRAHTVSRKSNSTFWKLLMRFGELTGVPVLLNTSFNLFDEPVVSTPRDAVRGFYCSGIDCLALGNFLIRK